MSVFSPTTSDADISPILEWQVCDHYVSALFGLAHLVPELRSQLTVAPLLVPSSHAPSPDQQEGTSDLRLEIAKRKDQHGV